MVKKPTTITIVGAGLVGSLLSIYLAKRGYQVSVYERRFDMRVNTLEGGRSINLALSNRGIQALEEVGLAEEMKRHSVKMKGRLMHDVKGQLTFQPYGKEGQFINSISRTGLNKFLIQEAEKCGVTFFFEHRCLEVDLNKTEVTFQHQNDIRRSQPDLVIGADGAFSAIRTALQTSDRFDYEQRYLEHGYKELRIPPGEKGEFMLEKEALHIWPRESYMLIALPNPDATFTCTLFFPFEGDPSFKKLKTPEQIKSFFETTFPDAVALMPSLIEDFRDNPTSSLVTIRCRPWVKKNTMVIGDAAHGVVPFYGQGMNSGFEDCAVLNQLLNKYEDDWKQALREFQEVRIADADAIAQLALDNFVEMRDLVADPDFLLRKKIEARCHELYPNKWIPLYAMVTFHNEIRYSEAQRIGSRQKAIMDKVMKTPSIQDRWQELDYADLVSKLTLPQ
ncbi:MAG: NAD(P)/FAD-dependent oxidoreductase [Cytophagales bacterium]|nr:NAD(P)/FAD-dependent oxidoreductase [Cytophagales bacterium]